MTKKKLNNHKTEAVPTTDTWPVFTADKESVAPEDPEPILIQETQGQSPIAVQPEPQPVPQMSRIQRYWIATMLIFADCSVQKSPEGIFDVLARNFDSTGAMEWWLWRIGHGEMTRYVKGKDIVDAIRKVSAELYRDLSRNIGKPLARL